METKPETLAIAGTLQEAIAATIQAQRIDGASFITVPPNHTLKNISSEIEKEKFAPNRKLGVSTLKNLDSFLTYCSDQAAQSNGYIYADPDSMTFTAVFNDLKNGSGWRDHRASYKSEFTPEFLRWKNKSGNDMGQTEFAEFIEDNFADIDPAQATTLLEVAGTIQAKTDINFSSAKRLDNGQVQLQYNETIDARAGVAGALQIPREFTLGLRIFKQGIGYKLRARLKYRLHAGSVKFRFELDRPERAVEDAFAGYIETVREKSAYTLLVGQA